MHKEEGTDITKMPVTLMSNQRVTDMASRLHHNLHTEGADRNKVAMATGMLMVRLPGPQDTVSPIMPSFRDFD